ncbi:Syntaxin/t-SNARE family protein [Prunus dulcis]|uniref:Syntaxin/t-SNARE family protein n=1 Tax=Prunus dulcis TaxID=3755 RepID=A0A4Y1RUP4_PRUDU|nr:Syntaxin/t-SNARE family protein [Prunus dulcis]
MGKANRICLDVGLRRKMESVFRLLLHELSLIQGDCPDLKLLVSIDYHKRDLATTLETAKWQVVLVILSCQLEDFERAVSFSATAGKPQLQEDRTNTLCGEELGGNINWRSMRNTEWVNLNEQDRDGLALFLSGGNDTDHSGCYDVEDNSILERFLDPITSSAKDSTSGIVEHKSRGIENLNMNGVVPLDRAIDSRKENNWTKVGSYNRFGEGTRLSSELTDYFPETSGDRYGGDGSRDLEANEAKPESFFCEDKLRRFCSITNVLGFLNNIRTVYGSRVTRNYTKRFKDGEEQSHSPSCAADVSHAAQGQRQGTWLAFGYRNFRELCVGVRSEVMYLQSWLGVFRARYQRSPYDIQVQWHSVQLVYWCPGLLRDIHSFGHILQSVCARGNGEED